MGLWDNLYNNTISVVYSSINDKWGDSTRTVVYSSVPCRIEDRTVRIVDATTDVIEYQTRIFVSDRYTILKNYEVVVDSVTYRVMDIKTARSIFGKIDHYELLVK